MCAYRINLNKTETHAVIGNDRREEKTEREKEREEREEVPSVCMHVHGNPYIALWQQRSGRQ